MGELQRMDEGIYFFLRRSLEATEDNCKELNDDKLHVKITSHAKLLYL